MAAFTVSAASVGSAGTVLVNGDGRTLYLLSSEKGGKLTCTDANGCTKYWPPVELPSGVTKPDAGTGIQKSLLGTVRSSAGDLYVTYGGWPLYTFSGDTSGGTANGVGVTSFGGTWYAVSTSGGPAGGAASTTPASTTPATSGSGGGGYGGY
jgi:predicted lipoprotein with Yx(FWY)xxD motif